MAPTSSRALKKDGMQFGFSIVGVVFLAMLFVPNIIWGRNQPPGYAEISKNENRILLALERIGEVAATCTAVIFVCPQGFSFPWLLWLIAAFALMILYEIAWMRYFRGGAVLADLAPGPDGKFTLIAAEVTLTAQNDAALTDVRGWFAPPAGLTVAEFLEAYSRRGGTHHVVLSYDGDVEILADFAHLMNWDFQKVAFAAV